MGKKSKQHSQRPRTSPPYRAHALWAHPCTNARRPHESGDPGALLRRFKSAHAGRLGLTLTRIIAAVLRFNHASVAWKSSGFDRRGAFANCLRTAATSSAIHRCCADPAGGAAPAPPHRYVDRSRPLHGGVPRVGRHTCDTHTGSLRRACIPPTAAVAPRHSESAALSELAPPRNCRSWRRSIRRSSVAWSACPCISEPTRAASTAQPPLARTVDQRNLLL
jgi:hypothetical protein